MASQTWVFLNQEDGAKIRFSGDVAAARAFLQVLKTHCHGQWGLQGESSSTQAEAAPAAVVAPAPAGVAAPESVVEPAAAAASAPAQARSLPPRMTVSVSVAGSGAVPVTPSAGPVPTGTLPGLELDGSDPALLTRAGAPLENPQELPGLAEPAPAPAPEAEPEPVDPGPNLPASIFKTASANGKRKAVRYSFPFRVILTAGGKSFRSQCQDISIGGMKLKHRPPQEMCNQSCNVFIGSPFAAENIELKCKLIPDPQSPLRVRFVDASPTSLKKLEDWILAAEKASKKAA